MVRVPPLTSQSTVPAGVAIKKVCAKRRLPVAVQVGPVETKLNLVVANYKPRKEVTRAALPRRESKNLACVAKRHGN